MINRILNFFGNNNTYNQSSIDVQNNYSSEIKTLLESFDGYFYEGKIVKALELLESAINEHKHKESKYYLLLKKAEYFLELGNIEKTKNLLELLEKDYSDYNDIKYKELLLSIYSAEKKEQEFFEVVKYLKAEKEDIKSDDYFRIIFYLNSGNINESKKLFNSLSKEEREKNNLIGGHIFSNSYNYLNKNEEDLEKANKYYKLALEENPNFFIKLHINGFFVQIIVNNYFRTEKDFNSEKVIQYKESLETLFEAEVFLNKYYIDELKVFKAYILLILNLKDEYIKFYENNSEILFDEHYMQYCTYKNININHSLIQKRLDRNDKLLLIYSNLLKDKNERIIILEYFEKNKDFVLKSDIIVYFYIKASIDSNRKILKKAKDYIDSNFETNFNLYFSHLLLKDYNNNLIIEQEIETLFNFIDKKIAWNDEIFDVINFFKKIKKPELYIKLAISKQNEFNNLIEYIFKICYQDKEVRIDQFEYFIQNIGDIVNFNSYIADIYSNKFNRLDKAFEFYYKTWENDKNLVSAKYVLSMVLHNFERYKNRLDEDKENEVLYYLQSMQKELDFTDISLISYFNLVINRDVNNAFGIINKKILSLNIYELDNENKKKLAAMYFNSITNFQDNEINGFQKNTVYFKKGNYYLDKELFKDINEIYIKKFKIKLIDKIEIATIKDDKTYKEKSLFHSIINEILETIENASFVIMKIDAGKERPFEKLQELLSKQNINSIDLIRKYSNGKDIGFWNLAKGYDKYFNLIIKLIEDESLNFNSCKVNLKEKSVPKLLTLSSIIFLNYWNKLDNILKREDIYIQKTTFNWLLSYIEKIEKNDELLYVFEENNELYKNIITKEQIGDFLNNLKCIVKSIAYVKIVDDTKATLLYEESFSITEDIGIQEYHAIAFSFQENYQIITEDKMLETIFQVLKFNPTMISNSLSLLKKEEIIELGIILHKKNYKYVFDITIAKSLINSLINILKYKDIATNGLTIKDINLLKILDDYGFLEKIKEIYFHHYEVYYPKIVLPEQDILSKNLKYILKILNADR